MRRWLLLRGQHVMLIQAVSGSYTRASSTTRTASAVFHAPPMVYHEAYSCPWPEAHRFPMAKFRVLKDSLVNSGAFRGNFDTPPHPMETPDAMRHVYAVHDKQYVDRFIAGQLTYEEKRRIGLDFNDHLVYRTLAEVGGTMHTCDLAMQHGMACNLAGGTHHAHYDFGSGFTVINDLAVAARRAVRCQGLRSVLVFDLDVHQGIALPL